LFNLFYKDLTLTPKYLCGNVAYTMSLRVTEYKPHAVLSDFTVETPTVTRWQQVKEVAQRAGAATILLGTLGVIGWAMQNDPNQATCQRLVDQAERNGQPLEDLSFTADNGQQISCY
jgi:hypothetical protein